MNEIKIEVHYFEGCPNADEMLTNVRIAVRESQKEIIYKEINIKDLDEARFYSFRGSPSLIINNDDFEKMPAPENPKFSCRLYKNGIPSVREISEKIMGI